MQQYIFMYFIMRRQLGKRKSPMREQPFQISLVCLIRSQLFVIFYFTAVHKKNLPSQQSHLI